MEQSDLEESGGIPFSGTLEDIYRANLALRCASRVLVRMPSFRAAAFPELRRKASRLPWEGYFSRGHSVAFRVTCHKSRLYHGEAVAERVSAAIQDRLGFPIPRTKWNEGASKDGLQLILIRLVHDACTISVDASGPLLHRRGYRLATVKAPLRETLACSMLFASRWNKTAPLMDPFCGSGTLPIEAALWSRGIAPGHFRRFSFMNWPGFDPQKIQVLLKSLEKHPIGPPPMILASDRDKGAVRAARENAERCGMLDFIRFSELPISAIEAPKDPGWVVSNPPFGIRIGQRNDLRNLFAQLGKTLRAKCPGWKVTLLCLNQEWIRYAGLIFDSGIPVLHGGRRVWIFQTRV
jgi:putative N6-adenine-specific DNA methylase